jgi:transposase
MLQITPHMRILLAIEPADFRKGIDSLASLCRNHLRDDPFSGTLYIFKNRRGTSIKILLYDSQGFWLATKRLSQGRFRWWPCGEGPTLRLEAFQLQLLLWNGDPSSARTTPPWRPIAAAGP